MNKIRFNFYRGYAVLAVGVIFFVFGFFVAIKMDPNYAPFVCVPLILGAILVFVSLRSEPENGTSKNEKILRFAFLSLIAGLLVASAFLWACKLFG